jgi:hypothetical protein
MKFGIGTGRTEDMGNWNKIASVVMAINEVLENLSDLASNVHDPSNILQVAVAVVGLTLELIDRS